MANKISDYLKNKLSSKQTYTSADLSNAKISNSYNSQNVPLLESNMSDVFKRPSQQPLAQNKYVLPGRGATITDEDFEAFKPLLYGEVSNRDYKKKQMEAEVIFNTVLNRQPEYAKYKQNKTISEILAMPNQYQAYGGKQYAEYANPTLPMSITKKKEVDMIVEDIKRRVKSGEFKDTTEGAYYYIHNPDYSITYDNMKKLFK